MKVVKGGGKAPIGEDFTPNAPVFRGQAEIIECSVCKSTDWIERPSGAIICVDCGAPVERAITKQERP